MFKIIFIDYHSSNQNGQANLKREINLRKNIHKVDKTFTMRGIQRNEPITLIINLQGVKTLFLK